jgi:hypothetical protein
MFTFTALALGSNCHARHGAEVQNTARIRIRINDKYFVFVFILCSLHRTFT